MKPSIRPSSCHIAERVRALAGRATLGAMRGTDRSLTGLRLARARRAPPDG